MSYIFCLLLDIAVLTFIAWLGWLVWRGATSWIVLVMLVLLLALVFPGEDLFTCPKCGNMVKVQVYKRTLDTPLCIQKGDNNTYD